MKRQRKIFLYFSLFVFHFSFVQAQHKIDSLEKLLSNAPGDSVRLELLYSIGEELYVTDQYHKSDSVTKIELALAQKIGSRRGEARANAVLGNICWSKGEYSKALAYQNKSLGIYTEIDNKNGIAATYGNIANVYYYQSNYPEALKYYLQSEKTYRLDGNKKGEASQEGNVGLIYYEQGNFSEAVKCQMACVKYDSITNDRYSLENSYGNLGNIYYTWSKYDSALKCYSLALSIAKEIDDKQGQSIAYGGMGLVYRIEGNYAEALMYCKKDLEIAESIGDRLSISGEYETIASVLAREKNYAQSKIYLDSSLALSKQVGNRDNICNTYQTYAIVDSAMGDNKGALNMYKNYITYRDSLKNEGNTKKIVSEQMQYDFDKKEAAAKAEQDKKDAIAEADKRKQKSITASIGAGLLLVLIFSGLLFSRFRITQRQKEIIERQKLVVEEKNKEILDSITYAKRLQDAILPPLGIIQKYLPESFVLYKPKDIVAGDFYWMEHVQASSFRSRRVGEEEKAIPKQEGTIKGDIVLVATADCTGHGVPGAMVSVVCSNALNRTVKEFRITETGKILDKVRNLVLETFEKSEKDVQDGMDISLCAINRETGEVQWSGAYNELWYVQNNELKEIQADKQPIGKTDNPHPFTTQNVHLKRGDMLYLFTDGYADQFGGPKGKKFKYKQLQELLVANYNKPMAEQRNMLEEIIEKWKGNLEQTDDICIIGIRI